MTAAEVVPELLRACPTFDSKWRRDRWKDEETPLYVILGWFAHHLLEMKREGRNDVLTAAGAFIGRMYSEGDASVREAATVGILEDVQNVWSNEGVSLDEFVPFLTGESTRWWASLNEFWAGRIPFVGFDITEANQSTDPTLSSVTPPAGQESRPR